MRKELVLPTALVGMVILYSLINPLRTEHLAMLGAGAGFWFLSRTTRHFVLSFAPFLAFVWMYDLLRIFADSAQSRVTIAGVHKLELGLFGVEGAAGILSPNELLSALHHVVLDVLGGIWYASHVGVIIMLGVYLWWRSRREKASKAEEIVYQVRLNRFMWGFFLLNVGMFLVNLLFPVAPPWYVEQYGYAWPTELIGGDPGGLARLDAFLGIEYFTAVYNQNAYVFGAMPSGHTAYAVWFALNIRRNTLRPLGWLYALGMAFFAIYLSHHYLLDVIAGTMLATTVYLLIHRTPVRILPCFAQRLLERLFDREAEENDTATAF
ncbi:MAG: phosphatase PAP2 family protein [Bradymonadaceae bacterium]